MFTFTLPRPPVSKKNGTIIVQVPRAGGGMRPLPIPSARAKADEAMVRAIAILALKDGVRPALGDDDVRLSIEHFIDTDEVRVSVCSAGPRRKGKTGRKRDIPNLPILIADALEGIFYGDDRQVSELHVRRCLSTGWPAPVPDRAAEAL